VQALTPQLAALEAQWEVLHAVSGAADAEELLAMWQGAEGAGRDQARFAGRCSSS